MTTRLVARCSIYDMRPKMCSEYPTVNSYIPPECTYEFSEDGSRSGSCSCGVGACCAIPRRNGDPLGEHLSSGDGGAPCRYLVIVEEESVLEKEAAAEDLFYKEALDEVLRGIS